MRPVRVSEADLGVLLHSASLWIGVRDSSAGSISWDATEDPGVFEVTAVIRTDTSHGQGGMLIVGTPEEPESPRPGTLEFDMEYP